MGFGAGRWVVIMVAVAGVWLSAGTASAADGDRLREIRARGYINCGLRFAQVGFVATDPSGRFQGMIVDFCRALAVAVLGDPEAFAPRNLPDKPQEMAAVEGGEVDISFSTTTWTLGREAAYNIAFVQPIFYDGQSFAAWRDGSGDKPLLQLTDQQVCVKINTTTVRNLQDMIENNRLRWKVRTFKTLEQAVQAFLARECTMLTTDRSVLQTLLEPWNKPGGVVIYPDQVSREPWAPYVATTDRQWLEVVRWTISATILAESKGLRARDVSSYTPGRDAELDRMLGYRGGLGGLFGLSNDWARNVIAKVGNYGEIFDRNLGVGSPYRMPRGLNELAERGGLMYAPPFQ